MKKITVAGRAEDREAILDLLLQEGSVEIVPVEQEEETLREQADERELATLRFRTEQVIAEIERRFPVKKGLFNVRQPVQEERFVELLQRPEQATADVAAFERLLADEASLNSEKTRLAAQQAQLLPWLPLPIDLGVRETDKTTVIYGLAHDAERLSELAGQLAEEAPETALLPLREEGQSVLLAVVARKSDTARVRVRLASADFHALPQQDFKGTPRQIHEKLTRESITIENRLTENRVAQEELASRRRELKAFYDALSEHIQKLQATAGFGETTKTVYFTGWIPARQAARTVRHLKETFTVATELREPEEGEDFPILLENNRFNSAFEVILKLFGAPSPTEVDPMPVMAPFYMLIFGMMLSDVGYGALLTAGAAYLLYKVKVEGNLRSMSLMLFLSGIASVFWGFLFGGFFGDMLTVLTQGRFVFPALWFDPMDSSMELLIFCMLFGVVHLFFGMALKIVNEKRNGRLLNGLMEVVPWYVLIVGLLLLLSASTGVLGDAALVSAIGKWMSLIGAGLVILAGGRGASNPISWLLKGLLALYDITGFLSDVLSYARILALVLATSVIAVVFNSLAGIAIPSLPGYIIFFVLAVPMHALNLALSALSAYVHASRLQYVEMFGKFFDGGGQYFRPLARQTKYIRVVSDLEDSTTS